MASDFIKKLAEIDEGKAYLNMNSKISYEIKKIIKKRGHKLEYNTLERLNSTLEILLPSEELINNTITNVYYCEQVKRGI